MTRKASAYYNVLDNTSKKKMIPIFFFHSCLIEEHVWGWKTNHLFENEGESQETEEEDLNETDASLEIKSSKHEVSYKNHKTYKTTCGLLLTPLDLPLNF